MTNSWEDFDTEEYAWRNYGGTILEIDKMLIKEVQAKLLQMGIAPFSLKCVADIGTGPNIYPAMLLAPFIAPSDEGGGLELIDHSDRQVKYLKQLLNLHPVQPSLQIWVKYDELLSKFHPLWRNSLGVVSRMAKVSKGNVYNLPNAKYDAVSSFFVAESITDSRQECSAAVDGIIESAKAGGVVIIAHILNSTSYFAGENTKFPAVPLDYSDLDELYEGKLTDMTIIKPPITDEIREDYNGMAIVIGKRPEERAGKMISDVEKSFSAYDTEECLYDAKRVEHLKKAIYETVRPGDIVVDAGSGTGLLALFAAKAGAAKVYCIELNADSAEQIMHNARRNGEETKIEVIQGDATKVDLPSDVDVIICEIISAGFFYEPQLQVMDNLQRFLKRGGRTVPASITNYVEVIEAQEYIYGLNLGRGSRYRDLDDRQLTTKARYSGVIFTQKMPQRIESRTKLRCMTPGRANAIRVTYTINFSESVQVNEPTEFLLNPQIIFLENNKWLKPNSYYDLNLSYAPSSLPCNAHIELTESELCDIIN